MRFRKVNIGTKFRSLFRNKLDRARLKNRDFTILTNHCLGGIILHDLGLQFNTPTVNLKILPDDFIRFLEDPHKYASLELVEIPSEFSYPMGMLGDIPIYFVHYKTFEEAKAAWERRLSRVNWDNLRIMMTIRDGCTQETLERFEALPYRHKVFFANEPHPNCPSCHYARLDNGKPLPGYISDIINIWGKRAFQCNGFNYIQFLNK